MPNTITIGSDELNLAVKFTTQQGKKFFPITHRKAIMGLSTNSLVLSKSLEIDVNEADNTITINPVVKTELDVINNNITVLETTIKKEINTQIENLWTKVNGINYALSTSPGGPANSAMKLTNPFTITVGGDAIGSVSLDGSSNVTLDIEVSKTKNNYAGAAIDCGAANSAVKLDKAVTIGITGAVTGSVLFDGSEDIVINVERNHNHDDAYSLLTHDHDAVYSKLDHTHNYAGSSSVGGSADSAVKLDVARTIALTGAVTGSGSFDGSANLSIATTVNHTHAISEITNLQTTLNNKAASSHNHDSVYAKLASANTFKGNVNTTARFQQNGKNGSIVWTESTTPSYTTMVWAY